METRKERGWETWMALAIAAFPLLGCTALEEIDAVDQEARPIITMSAHGNPSLVQGPVASLSAARQIFGIEESDLRLIREKTDSLGFHHQRWEQVRDGLPVINGDLRVTRNASGEIAVVGGAAWNADATTSVDDAIDDDVAAAAILDQVVGSETMTAPRLVFLAPSSGAPIVLAWESFVRGSQSGELFEDKVFVSAATGELVDRHPQIHTARNRRTNDAEETPISPEGNVTSVLARAEGAPAVGITEIDIIHDSMGDAYDCLNNLFGRDSFDNLGAELFSIGRIGEYQNASWNSAGRLMAYGVGFVASDVVIHEVTHAVTEFTSALVYQNESGALNESFSDILAATCEASKAGREPQATDWQIGEELAIGPFRFMDNPTQDGNSTDHYETRYVGELDQGGVHLNSGIGNLAFVLAVTGGEHPRLGARAEVASVMPVGLDTAAAIFYRAFSTYLGPNSDFLAARMATQQAAIDLFGPSSSEEISITEAWASVGVGGPSIARAEDTEPDPDPESEPESDLDGSNLSGGCSSTSGSGTGMLTLLIGLCLCTVRRRRCRSPRG